MKTYEECRYIPTVFNLGTEMEVDVKLHSPVALTLRKNILVSMLLVAGSGPYGEDKIS
jgi:hypothetical protein